MGSRVLGFARDIMMAAYLGSGPVAQAFIVAFRLPNLFRRFFAEGAFNTAFVPLFAKRLEGEGPDAARAFAGEAFSGLLAVLLALTLVAQLAMPLFVLALASGYETGGDRFDLATAFSRVTFPYIVFISLAALFSGILNAFGRFAAAAAAPVLLNVILCTAMGLAAAMEWNVGWALSWGVFAAGIAQFLLVARAAAKLGMRLPLRRPRLTPDMRRLVAVGLPAALAARGDADQPAGRHPGCVVFRRGGGVALDGGPGLPASPRRDRNRHRGRPAARACAAAAQRGCRRRPRRDEPGDGVLPPVHAARHRGAAGGAGDRVLDPVPARRLHGRGHRRHGACAGDLCAGAAGLRAPEGGAALVLRAGGHAHAAALRGCLDGDQRGHRRGRCAADRVLGGGDRDHGCGLGEPDPPDPRRAPSSGGRTGCTAARPGAADR